MLFVIENLSFSITGIVLLKNSIICNTKKMIEKVIVKKAYISFLCKTNLNLNTN